MAKRWDERGKDDKTLNKLRVEVMLGNREDKRRATWKRKTGIAKKRCCKDDSSELALKTH